MKRVLSLVLALSLVLGSIPAGFAATPTAGETLKGYGLVTGNQNGDLEEGKEITRAEMMVVLARLLGKFDEAKAYSIPSTSKDVAGHWAAAYIAFAEKEAWTAGKGNGMFDPNGKVTLQETAAFMMKALGYTVTDFSKVVEEATKLNILKDVNGEATKAILRADLFTAALNTINTPSKDSTQKLGEKLGVIKVEASALDPKKVTGISQNTIQITLNAAATAVKASDFSVVDKAGKAFEVKEAALIDSKTVWIKTEDLTAGTLYTVKVAGKTFSVTGVQKDKSLPEIVKSESRVQDNTGLRIVFNKDLDPRNALVAANYTFTNGLTATAVAFEKDKNDADVRTVLLITTSAQEVNKLYKLTVGNNVTDAYGNKVQSEDEKKVFSFTGLKADTTAPRIKSVTAENGQKLVVEFNESSDLASNALDFANYVFVDKTDSSKTVTATAAKFMLDAASKKTIVKLTTTAQIEKHSYELTVNNVTDKFGNPLAANKTGFVGAPLDTAGPRVDGIETLSNTVVKVIFNEDVEAASATVAANYVINNDLAVTNAEVDSKADNIIWLTTSAQKTNVAYKLTVSNVKDTYGNAISTSNVKYFNGMAEDNTRPKIDNAYAFISNGNTYVKVVFSKAVKESTATVAANYNFGDHGYALSVTKDAANNDKVFNVKVNTLVDGKTYKLVVTNVEDLAGNVIDYDKARNEFTFVGKVSDDTASPRILTAVTVDYRTVKVIFDKAMNPTQLVDWATYFKLENSDGTAKAATLAKATKSSDNKEVSFRFTTDVFKQTGYNETYKLIVKPDTTAPAFSGLRGVNQAAVDTAYADYNIYSTSVEPAAVKVINATSTSINTVDVKFNQSIETFNLDVTKIVFKNLSTTNKTDIVAKLAEVSYNNDDVLKVTTASNLIAGDKYEVSFLTMPAAQIKDAFGTHSLDAAATRVDTLVSSFYASSNSNVEPSLITYSNGSLPGQIDVTMSEEVSVVTGNMTLAGEKAINTITKVERSTADHAKFTIFFNNTDMIEGKTYTITLKPGAVVDLNGQKNTTEIKLTFGVTSKDRDAVKIEGVTIAKTVTDTTTSPVTEKYTQLTVVFNKAVANLTEDDFEIVLKTSQGAVVADYTAAASITAAKNAYNAALKADAVVTALADFTADKTAANLAALKTASTDSVTAAGLTGVDAAVVTAVGTANTTIQALTVSSDTATATTQAAAAKSAAETDEATKFAAAPYRLATTVGAKATPSGYRNVVVINLTNVNAVATGSAVEVRLSATADITSKDGAGIPAGTQDLKVVNVPVE